MEPGNRPDSTKVVIALARNAVEARDKTLQRKEIKGMRKRIMLAGAMVGLLLLTTVASKGIAQSKSDFDALKKQIDALLEGQKAMQKDIQAIKDIASGKKPPLENVLISLDGSHSIGEESAPVTVVEFADYQCPFCGRHAATTYGELLADYVKTGKVRYIYKDFPLERLHPFAFKAAEAAQCAGEQGRYWEMHDRLFKNQDALTPSDLKAYGVALELDTVKYQQCLDSDKYATTIRSSLQEGQKYGVTGTPSFFFGTYDAEQSKVKAISAFSGAQPYPNFQKAIDAILNPPKEDDEELDKQAAK